MEALVVLALLAVAAGAVGLSLRPAPAGDGPAHALAARLTAMSAAAQAEGRTLALAWDAAGWRIEARDGAGWAPHPLGGAALAGLPGTGRWVLPPDLLPAAPLELAVAGRRVVSDGLTGRVE